MVGMEAARPRPPVCSMCQRRGPVGLLVFLRGLVLLGHVDVLDQRRVVQDLAEPFVVSAAGLQAFGTIPAVGIALIVGVDRFMSEARAITNLIGNAVATMVIARWEPGGRNDERFREVLDDPSLIQDMDVPEEYETPQEYAESHRPPALTH